MVRTQEDNAGFGKDKNDWTPLDAIEEIRRSEFSRLKGTTYADYAGASLYSEKQLADIFQVSPTLLTPNSFQILHNSL